ncbi:coiled-coil domain-containing protein R3HCC1L isoform X1 [Gadus chalcogrammus]|uniref:coiled-coil domain-containing protein R3HCC1L isoform X1 n=2 Tax=Gadus chalcogrammus TaxID=1042646 RepID=UPI0024C29906|nr:coiled-coil domain-containing protein R3HCC1L isoform X1 [Gadus chalcogrammus]
MELEQANNKDEVVPTEPNKEEVVNNDEVVPSMPNKDEVATQDEVVPSKPNKDEVENKDEVVPTKPLTTNTSRSKKQDKKRLDASKDKAQTEEETKPRPRPKYSDKSRKNKKNKSGQENKTEAVVEDTKVEESQGTEEPLDEDHTLTKQEGTTEITSEMEILALNSENEEDSWDTLFNDDGDCLEEGKGRKKKNVQDPEFDYYNMDQEADEELEMTDDELSHIVEIYDFSQEFKTEDLLKLFESSQLKGLDIHWVDESHALALFSSAVGARDALRSKQPLLKVRPLSKSSAATKAKARSCSDYLLPAKERPPTSAMLARRMVMGALGVKSPQSKEDRDAEKKKIQEARDQKRMAAKQREDAWEGK